MSNDIIKSYKTGHFENMRELNVNWRLNYIEMLIKPTQLVIYKDFVVGRLPKDIISSLNRCRLFNCKNSFFYAYFLANDS